MTEYDYSPDAWERYIATQDRIARWVDGTKTAPPCNAFAPATPHVEALALKEKERRRQRRRDYGDSDSDASIDTEYEEQRRRRRRERHQQRRPPQDRRKGSSRHAERPPLPDFDDFVFVERPSTPTSSKPPRSTHSTPTKPRKGPTNLTLDLAPFPTSGIPPQDPYSYRNSHSSHSSNTTTPTSATPTYSNGMFPSHQLPIPPYSAPPVAQGQPKPRRTQTMPMQPPAYPPGFQQAYTVNPVTGQPILVSLRPGMKGYASYGPDPAKSAQIPWNEHASPTKQPSLLKRMFTGLTGSKHSRSQAQTPQIPQYPFQYPTYATLSPQSQYPQKAPYPQSTYPQQQFPSQQYPQPLPPYSGSPNRPRYKDKDSMMFLGGGGKRVQRKRSISF